MVRFPASGLQWGCHTSADTKTRLIAQAAMANSGLKLLDFGMSNIAQQNIQIRVNIRFRRAIS
jgi:hypothetical protein